MNCGRRLEEAKGVFPLKGVDPRVRGREMIFCFLFSVFFVFLLQLSEDERITRVGWVLLNVWPAGLVGVVFFLFLFLFSAS
jgi:hypothetical protein